MAHVNGGRTAANDRRTSGHHSRQVGRHHGTCSGTYITSCHAPAARCIPATIGGKITGEAHQDFCRPCEEMAGPGRPPCTPRNVLTQHRYQRLEEATTMHGRAQASPAGACSGMLWSARREAASSDTPSLCQPPTLRSPWGMDIARKGGACWALSALDRCTWVCCRFIRPVCKKQLSCQGSIQGSD